MAKISKKFYTQIEDSLKNRDYSRIESIIENMNKKDMRSDLLANIKGNYFMLIGDFDSALENFNNAIRENPLETVFYRNRAKLYTKFIERDFDYIMHAIFDYQKIIDLLKKDKKDISEILLDMGCLCFELGEDTKGCKLLDEAIDGFDKKQPYKGTIWAKIRLVKDSVVRKYYYKLYYYCMKLRGKFEYTKDEPLAHYTTVNGLMKILGSDDYEFRASNVAYMDDVREGMQIYRLFQCKLKNYDKLSNVLKIGDGFTPHCLIQRNAYLMSFSRRNDDFRMWKDYGNKGDGCVIIFNRRFFDSDISFDLTSDEPDVIKNDYDKNIPYILQYVDGVEHPELGQKEFEKICQSVDLIINESSDFERYSELFMAIIDRIAFLYKIKDCEPDCEVRLVKYKDIDNVNIDNEYLEHARSPKLYIPISISESIDSIVLGSCVSTPNQLVQFLYKKGIKKIELSTTAIS